MDSIFDSKRWWNWGTGIVSGGLAIAALFVSGPIGWALGIGVAVVGIGGWLCSFLFDDREMKAREAREKLSNKLSDNINRMENNLRDKLQDWFCKELIDDKVYSLLSDINIITSALFELADAQRTLAWTLNDRIKNLSRTLIEEALKHVCAAGMEYHIRDIARVPGCAVMFVISPVTIFPNQVKIDIEWLLGESICFVIDNGNPKSILSQAIGYGCNRSKISIEWKLKTAHVPIGELDAFTLTRVKLAQQLTGLHITK